MFVVWNFHGAQQKFDVLSVHVQESVENRGATQLSFTINTPVSDYLISAFVKQEEYSDFSCCDSNLKQFILTTDN